MEPGLCIAYRNNVGDFRQGICNGALADEATAPESFAALYRAIFHPGQPVSMPLLIEGNASGVAVATFDPATQIGQSWRETSRLLSIMAFALAGLCLAVYAALARARQGRVPSPPMAIRTSRTLSSSIRNATAAEASAKA